MSLAKCFSRQRFRTEVGVQRFGCWDERFRQSSARDPGAESPALDPGNGVSLRTQ